MRFVEYLQGIVRLDHQANINVKQKLNVPNFIIQTEGNRNNWLQREHNAGVGTGMQNTNAMKPCR
jgi:hypothetical protein